MKRWSEASEGWHEETSLSKEMSKWAVAPIASNRKAINQLEDAFLDALANKKKVEGIDKSLNQLKKAIKNKITVQENELDDLVLNTPNSYKLQLSVPSNLNYLMKAWAAAEGRDLSSIALQCLESGLREMKSKGEIPLAAIKRYDISCEKRIALAEAHALWEKHGRKFFDQSDSNE